MDHTEHRRNQKKSSNRERGSEKRSSPLFENLLAFLFNRNAYLREVRATLEKEMKTRGSRFIRGIIFLVLATTFLSLTVSALLILGVFVINAFINNWIISISAAAVVALVFSLIFLGLMASSFGSAANLHERARRYRGH